MIGRDYVVALLFVLIVSAVICLIVDLMGSPIDTFSLVIGVTILTIGVALVSHGRDNWKFCRNEEKFLHTHLLQSTDAQSKLSFGAEDTSNFVETIINDRQWIGSFYVAQMIGGLTCSLIGLIWLALLFG